jgi:Ca2+-dependent lipid-binding protein
MVLQLEHSNQLVSHYVCGTPFPDPLPDPLTEEEEERLKKEELRLQLRAENGIAVKIHVIRARNLTAADSNMMSEDTSDPYAIVFVKDESKAKRTKTADETLSPAWREWVTIDGVDHTLKHDLTVQLRDADMVGSDDPLGEVKVSLVSAAAHYRDHGSDGCWFKLAGEGSGDGEVELGFEFDQNVISSLPETSISSPPLGANSAIAAVSSVTPAIGTGTVSQLPARPSQTVFTMKVHAIGARKLTAADSNMFSDDSSDPYAMLFVQDETKAKHTKTIEESLTPSWRDWLTFNGVELKDKLTVRVMDADVVGSDDPLGEVQIKVSDAAAQCRLHGPQGCWFKLAGEGSGDGEVELGFEFDPPP